MAQSYLKAPLPESSLRTNTTRFVAQRYSICTTDNNTQKKLGALSQDERVVTANGHHSANNTDRLFSVKWRDCVYCVSIYIIWLNSGFERKCAYTDNVTNTGKAGYE